MARILITGASGFIGSNLLEHCRQQGHEVLNVDIAEVRAPGHEAFRAEIDILDRSALFDAFDRFKPDLVHHLAARTDIDGKTLEDYKANTQGVQNVLEASQRAGARRVVVASSQLVNPLTKVPRDDFDYSPPNAYGASKVETEKIVRGFAAEGMEWVLIRPTTIWGPWFGVKYQGLYRQVKAGRFMLPKGRRIRKVWGYVGNAAWCLQRLAELPVERSVGRVFYVADYEPYDLGEYAEIIRQAWGAPPIKQVPLAALKAIAKVGDVMMAMGRSFPLHSYRLGNFMADMGVSAKPLAEACGPAPHTLQQGVQATVDWMKANPDFNRDASLH